MKIIYIYIYNRIYEKTWSMNITAVSLKLGQTRVFISPTSPKNTEKREKRERELDRENKTLKTVLSFYSVDSF